MNPRSLGLAFAATSALSLACTEAPTGPDTLSLEASVSSPSIALGQTDTLTFRLRNLTPSTISLTFGSSCQVQSFIETVNDGVVYPPHGGYVCLTVITTLTLAPFAQKTITQVVRGDTVPGTFTEPTLPPGRYGGHAQLSAYNPIVELRSPTVGFEIR